MIPEQHFIKTGQLQTLINILLNDGYSCIGPVVKDGTILYQEISSVDQLPRGYRDTQKPGHYSLASAQASSYFGFANGPQALKPLLFSPKEGLWESKRTANNEITFSAVAQKINKRAVIGLRACDLAGLKLQDQHFLHQQYTDSAYQARRENLLTIAVNCNKPAETCFCASTGDGPFVDDGFDLALTELENGFIIEAASHEGEKILQQLDTQHLSQAQKLESEQLKNHSAVQQRKLPQLDIKTRLANELNNNAWHEIATQCLSCGNCTAVCPTCFCHSEHDEPVLDGTSTTHVRQWDSCFTQGHSYIHGIIIRSETSQRYRQWLTHKFSSWHEQYGRSGCVGCGRCISWCPVGIDVIESIRKITDRRHD